MTDRERLIDLIKKAEKQELLDLFTADLDEAIGMSGGTQFNGSVEYLADYLISNGVIVPPCNVGDTVYVVYDDDCEEYVVKELCCGTLGSFRATAECNIHGYNNIFQCDENYCGRSACKTSFELREVGKTVFLTREEALNDMKQGDKT